MDRASEFSSSTNAQENKQIRKVLLGTNIEYILVNQHSTKNSADQVLVICIKMKEVKVSRQSNLLFLTTSSDFIIKVIRART